MVGIIEYMAPLVEWLNNNPATTINFILSGFLVVFTCMQAITLGLQTRILGKQQDLKRFELKGELIIADGDPSISQGFIVKLINTGGSDIRNLKALTTLTYSKNGNEIQEEGECLLWRHTGSSGAERRYNRLTANDYKPEFSFSPKLDVCNRGGGSVQKPTLERFHDLHQSGVGNVIINIIIIGEDELNNEVQCQVSRGEVTIDLTQYDGFDEIDWTDIDDFAFITSLQG